MNNGTNQRRPSSPAKQKRPDPSAGAEAVEGWPEDFPSRATVKLAVAGLAGIIAGAFLFWVLKLYFPSNRIFASVDTRSLAVFTGVSITAGGGLLHPSFGLAAVVLLRHWMDGITYPGDNAYFNCALLYLFVLWGARELLRGGRLRFRAPEILLAVFLGISVVSTFAGYEIASSYRTVLVWCSYFAMFIMVTHGLRSRRSIALIIGALLAAELSHAVYAIIQYEYVFDYTRQWLLENPARLQSFFGTDAPSPELMRRLNLNRAFGTMLFPNALAAFLILALPLSVCGAVSSVLRHNAAAAESAKPPRAASFRFGLIVAVVALFICFFATALVTIMAFMEAEAVLIFGVAFGISAVLGLIHGVIAQRYASSRGLRPAAYGMTAYFFLLLLAIQSVALWRTYSRGAMLALLLAGVAGALILWRGRGGTPRHAVQAVRALGILLAVLGCVVLLAGRASQAQAPASPPNANPQEITATGASEHLPLETRKLLERGADITLRELLDPSSFSMRLSYWKVGLRMAWDNLLLGVGPGNFEVAYPKYQTVDAGDVDTAHNDYLQTLCETGVLGLLAFLGFWGWMALWGCARVLREPEAAERWLLAGLYVGPLAFLLHCAVDFNFYNPSLVFYVMLLSALFYARAAAGERATSGFAGSALRHQIALLVLLVGAALCMGMNLRIYFQDYALSGKRLNVADEDRINRRYGTGCVFLVDLGSYGKEFYRARAEERKVAFQPPRILLSEALMFLSPAFEQMDAAMSLSAKLEQVGVLAVPTSDGGWRNLRPGEPLSANVWLWLNRQPWRTMGLARKAAKAWLAEVESIDAMFPHRPELAAYISEWCQLLLSATNRNSRPAEHAEYLTKFLEWTRTGVERSPERAEYRARYGLALWLHGDYSQGNERNMYCEKAIEQYRIAQQLRPHSSSRFNGELAFALKNYGGELISQGKLDEGRKFIDESVVYEQLGEKVQNERWRLGLS